MQQLGTAINASPRTPSHINGYLNNNTNLLKLTQQSSKDGIMDTNMEKVLEVFQSESMINPLSWPPGMFNTQRSKISNNVTQLGTSGLDLMIKQTLQVQELKL